MMKRFIKKVPIPLSGLMLATAALGNLLQSYSDIIRYICGMLSFILLILLVLKLVLFSKVVKEELRQPVSACVSVTFPMGLMLLSVYAKPILGDISRIIWYMAMFLHISIMIYVTYLFVRRWDIREVFASLFVVYVGINMVGITAPVYGKEAIGTAAFIFGFVSFLILLPLISYRYIKYKKMPDSAKPLVCIFASPGALCLTAYLQSIGDKDVRLVIFLLVLEGLLYLFVIIRLIPCLKLKFYPSYASFTFPFVISATAMKQAAVWFTSIGMTWPYLSYIALVQTIIATLLVTYTLIRYIQFLFCQAK